MIEFYDEGVSSLRDLTVNRHQGHKGSREQYLLYSIAFE